MGEPRTIETAYGTVDAAVLNVQERIPSARSRRT